MSDFLKYLYCLMIFRDIFWGFFLKWIFCVNDISCDFFEYFFIECLPYWIFEFLSDISLTNIFRVNSYLTELFEWFLCFLVFLFLIPFLECFCLFVCLYLSGVVFWGDFLNFVIFFLWIFWVIMFWVFF